MQTLNIEFQEGFQDDTVVVRVNGAEILRKDHVKTRLQTGFAAATSAEVTEGHTVIEVALPAAGISGQVEVEVQAPTWVGVNLGTDRGLHFKVSQSPFGYV
jgi:sulfur carrier protein ThiS